MSMKVLKSKIKFSEGPSGSLYKSTHCLLGPYSQTLAVVMVVRIGGSQSEREKVNRGIGE